MRLAPQRLYVGGRFEPDLSVEVSDGVVTQVGPAAPGGAVSLEAVELPGVALLPGFLNNHSHGFQRALRGRGQRFPAGAGSFWTWRQAMYDLVEGLDADRLLRVTTRAFTEMRQAGFSRVSEFQYLHHDRPDRFDFAFDQVIVEAARLAGIRLHLLLAAYQTSDCAGGALSAAQARFATPDLDRLWDQLDALSAAGVDVGVVAHSIRAVPPDSLAALWRGARARGIELHMHVEEQLREIEECKAAHGGRTPLAVILDVFAGEGGPDPDKPGGASFTAVHCTHSDPEELGELLRRGGRVCVCPTTEADLGDGVPAAAAADLLARHPGQVSIGTDSNARISALEELRWLEYAQRLTRRARGVWTDPAGELGPTLLTIGTGTGSPTAGIAGGAPADFAEVDLTHPALADVPPEHLPTALVLGCPDDVIQATWIRGVRHPRQAEGS